MGVMVERAVNTERVEDLISVFGSFDENIKRIEDTFGINIVNRDTELKVSGNEEMVDMADTVLIIWDGRSKGTQYTLKYANKINKPIALVQI